MEAHHLHGMTQFIFDTVHSISLNFNFWILVPTKVDVHSTRVESALKYGSAGPYLMLQSPLQQMLRNWSSSHPEGLSWNGCAALPSEGPFFGLIGFAQGCDCWG